MNIQRVESAFQRIFDELAGDVVTIVTKDGTEHNITAIVYNASNAYSDGIDIEPYGPEDRNTLDVTFHKSELDKNSITIDKYCRFIYKGKLYFLADGYPIRDTQVPIQALHSVVTVRIRLADERNETDSRKEWGWQ